MDSGYAVITINVRFTDTPSSTRRIETRSESVNAELLVIKAYALVVKSTGHKNTFPDDTATLLENDMARTCKNGRKHISAVTDKNMMLTNKKAFLEGVDFSLMLNTIPFHYRHK